MDLDDRIVEEEDAASAAADGGTNHILLVNTLWWQWPTVKTKTTDDNDGYKKKLQGKGME